MCPQCTIPSDNVYITLHHECEDVTFMGLMTCVELEFTVFIVTNFGSISPARITIGK